MTGAPSLRTLAAAVGAAAILASCASAPTRFYTLDAVVSEPAPAYASAYAGPPLRIEAVHAPPALDRLELTQPDGANGVRVRDLARWAGPLGELARQALTQDLAARLPQGAVVFPSSPKPPGARGVVVDILAIVSGADGPALDASWTLLPGTRGGSLRQRQVRLSTPSQPGPAGQAAELSALLGRLADAIAADLAADPPREPPAEPPRRPPG